MKFNSVDEGKRQEIIVRYENIVKKWESDPNQTLIKTLPNKYIEIKEKLRLLKEGYDFNRTDKTSELKTAIAFVGGQIPRTNTVGSKLIDKNNGISWAVAKEIASKC